MPGYIEGGYIPILVVQEVELYGYTLLCDLSGGNLQPLVPVMDRMAVFKAIHSRTHRGIRATRRLLTTQFIWRGVKKDVASL